MGTFKKYLGMFGLIALLVFMAACGPQDDNGEATEEENNETNGEYDLLVWEDVEKSVGIEEAIAQFEEDNDVTIKVVEKAYAQQIEDLRLDGPAGTGPDVLTMASDQIGTAVVEGLLNELSIEE